MIGKDRRVRQAALTLGFVLGFASLAHVALAAQEPKSAADARQRQYLLSGQEPAQPFVPLRPRTIEDTEKLEAITQYCIACKHESEGHLAEAIGCYRKAIEHDPTSIALYRAAIRACRAARRTQDALALMRNAEALAPDDFELLNWLGDSMWEDEQLDRASEYYRRSLESPNLPAHEPAVVLLKFKLGMIHEQAREYVESAKYYRDVVQAMERPGEYKLNSPDTQYGFMRNRAETYERFSTVFRQAKQFDDALRVLQLAQASQPRATRFSLNIAEVYIDQEKFGEALEFLERYLNEQTPQGSQAYERLAFVLGKLGRQEEVLPRVEAAAQRDRFNSGLQAFLGSLFESAGQID